jgi:hypothetical protein
MVSAAGSTKIYHALIRKNAKRHHFDSDFFQFWIKERRPLCCLSNISSSVRDGYDNGILPGNGYPIISCCEVEKNGRKLKLMKIAQPYFQGKIPSCAFDWPYLPDMKGSEPEAIGIGNKNYMNSSFFWIQFEDWCHEFNKGMSLSIQNHAFGIS